MNKPNMFLVVLFSMSSITTQCSQPDQFTRVSDRVIAFERLTTYGISWMDYNSDGFSDIFVANGKQGGGANYLFHNNGNGTFSTITEGIIPSIITASTASTWADFDNDGDVDGYVSNLGTTIAGDLNQLYLNNGNGTFENVTSSIIVADSHLSMSPIWVDYNNDGWLDLFVTNHCFPPCNSDVQNMLFMNNGNEFILQANEEIGLYEDEGNSASWADSDNDGDLDLYTTRNDQPSIFYENNGDGTFTNRQDSKLSNPDGASGAWVDYDNDGDLDLYTHNYGQNNSLYKNDGKGNFTEIRNIAITNDSSFSSSSAWGDYDNDGDLDVVLFCSKQTEPSEPRLNQLFSNQGDGTFTRINEGVLAADKEFSHAGEWADYDRDGDLDLFVAQIRDERNALYQNNGNGNNWINIKLIGTKSNRSAIGAKVKVRAEIGGRSFWQMREISSQSTFFAQSTLNVHFGIGDAKVIETIIIEWPSGKTELKENIDPNQFIEFTEGA